MDPEFEQERPIIRLESHESMKLFKVLKDGTETNKYYILPTFVNFLNDNNYAQNTILSYLDNLKRFLKKIAVNQPSFSLRDLYLFLTGKTVNAHAAIRAFLKYVEFEFNQKFVDVSYPKIKKIEEKVVMALKEDEIRKIIDALPDDDFKFFTTFLYKTGCRISEPLTLQVSAISWENVYQNLDKYALLKLSRTKGKRERMIPLSPSFTQELKEYLKSKERLYPSNYIFNFEIEKYFEQQAKKERKRNRKSPIKDLEKRKEYTEKKRWRGYIKLKSQDYQRAFRKASTQVLGIAYTPHILRKSRATNLLGTGIPIIGVRDFLGHRSLKTTERYLSTSIDELTKQMEVKGL